MKDVQSIELKTQEELNKEIKNYNNYLKSNNNKNNYSKKLNNLNISSSAQDFSSCDTLLIYKI